MTILSTTDLTALDRCDRCGGQAHARLNVNGTDLLFCEHHRRKHRDKIHEMLAAHLHPLGDRPDGAGDLSDDEWGPPVEGIDYSDFTDADVAMMAYAAGAVAEEVDFSEFYLDDDDE